jgi:hypothetical protein
MPKLEVPDDATWIVMVRDITGRPEYITSPKGEKAYFRQSPNVEEGKAYFISASMFRGSLLDGLKLGGTDE